MDFSTRRETFLEFLNEGRELTSAQVAGLLELLLEESAAVGERADLLSALSRKGETPGEIADFVRVLLSHARKVELRTEGGPVIDVCGTGGDKQGLFNISTAVMFVVAGCGARVAKHGNRGVTSRSGGADVLEALGVRIDLDPRRAEEVLDEVGCVFLFAPNFHPAFKAVAPLRRYLAERGETTVFNKLGPLLNPANPAYQLAGVFNPLMVPVYGQVFARLGRARAWAVHGTTPDGGLDEMSTLGPTDVCVMEGGVCSEMRLDSSDYGMERSRIEELRGGDAVENAALLDDLLKNQAAPALADMVAWNAAGALVVAGLASEIGGGLAMARAALKTGAAGDRLAALRAATRA